MLTIEPCLVVSIVEKGPMKRNLYIGTAFLATLVALGIGSSMLGRKA